MWKSQVLKARALLMKTMLIVASIVVSKFLHCIDHNKCKELLPTKFQFKIDKNPIWPRITDVVSTVKQGLLACLWRMLCWCLFYVWNFFFLKSNQILNFGGIPKFFKLIVFGQILAKFWNFGQIPLHLQWLTACPKQGWNLKNPLIHQLWIKKLQKTPSVMSTTLSKSYNWKTTIHIYCLKNFKNPQIYFIHCIPFTLYTIVR